MSVLATFAGVPCVKEASFTMRQGVGPSTGRVAFLPDAVPALTGTLVLSDGTLSRTFLGMHLIDPVINESEGGAVLEATVVDRRFYWSYGYVSGKWNQPDALGVPVEERELQVLLADCLTTVYGETLNFFSMPAACYPPVEWEFDNPSTACQELLEKYGLVLSLDVSGEVWIGPASYDRTVDLPTAVPMERETTYIDNLKPSDIVIVGSRNVNEWGYDLVPVGIEKTTLEIKKIDDLSYTPTEGWEVAIINDFEDIADATEKALAKKCIGKWFGYVPEMAGYRKAYLPWLSNISQIQAVIETDLTESDRRGLPYILTDAAETDEITYSNPGTWRLYEKPYTVDKKRGIVKFAEPIFKIANYTGPVQAINEIDWPLVVYEAACEDNNGTYADFYTKVFPIAGGTLGQYIHREPGLIDYKQAGVSDAGEKAALDAYATKVATALLTKFNTLEPTQLTYAFIATVEVYGDIKSITWRVSDRGATTVISVGEEEIVPYVPTYQERILNKKTAALHWPSEKRVQEATQRNNHNE